MKNKEITMYELIGLIKDGEAPKNIMYEGSLYTLTYGNNYIDADDGIYLFSLIPINEVLNDTVEILPEENDEWKDIEELSLSPKNISLTDVVLENRDVINQLIKNQKYLKEKLEGKDENNK